jgi:ESCRT-II complex subunit VPS25
VAKRHYSLPLVSGRLHIEMTDTSGKPSIYSFPPFYTRQVHEETWLKQASLWSEIITSHCKAHRHFVIPRCDPREDKLLSTITENVSIKRSLDSTAYRDIIDYMISREHATAISGAQVIVWWKSLSDWADEVYQYVTKYGLSSSGQVCTVYELFNGEDTADLGTLITFSCF